MPRTNLYDASQEYEQYLERYDWDGEDLPKLTAEEFCQLEDELMALEADRAAGGKLSTEQRKRLRELRRLLLATV